MNESNCRTKSNVSLKLTKLRIRIVLLTHIFNCHQLKFKNMDRFYLIFTDGKESYEENPLESC
jgi:hypothetical protein